MRKIAVLMVGMALAAGVRVEAQARERSQAPMRRRTQELPFRMIYGEGGRGWLGFSFDVVARQRLPREDSAHVHTPGEAVIVKEVRPGSPAERAGVQRGDTIISLNGLTTNERLVSSLATFLEPGDTVRLRVRRAGRERERERELKLIAEPRPSEFAFRGTPEAMVFEGDSVRSMMRLFLDSARMKLDTLQFPRMHIERTDSTIRYWTDGGGFGRPDTVTMLTGKWCNTSKSTPTARVLMCGDSVHGRAWRSFGNDSIQAMLRQVPRMPMHLDDLPPMAGMFPYPFDVGRRAIAGAELQDLTSELGEYFGVTHGVLVLRVGKATPAGEAGLRAGDVITKANTTAISTIEQLRRAISARSREPIKLQALRKKQLITIQLKADR